MKNRRQMQQVSESERKQYFGIRKLKVGVASIIVVSSIFFINFQNVTAYADTDGSLPLVKVQEVPASMEIEATTIEPTAPVLSAEKANMTASPVEKTDTSSSVIEKENTPEVILDAPHSVVTDEKDQVSSMANNVAEISAISQEDSSKREEKTQADTIAADTIRVHFENIESDHVDQYGVWTWGGVANPSDGTKWPTDVATFDAKQKDDFGYYVDLKQAEGKGDIGYLLLKNGAKLAEGDQKIHPLSKEMNEIWIKKDFSSFSYQPLADDTLIRINYKRDDNRYDGWGAWLWGDVKEESSSWPNGATDFTNVGAYGRYIDVPLSKLQDSKMNFLLVNQNDPESPGNKTIDLRFANRAKHSQIFLRNDDTTIYTNPYYVATVEEQDFSKAEPGKKNVSVTASSYRDFNFNETGIIDLKLTNPEQAKITRMQVDTSAIGGGIIQVSPELNRVTITAASTVAAGEYKLPVRVFDEDNGYYDTSVNVHIKEADKSEKAWDEQVIYFMLTDRFYNGDKSNDNPYAKDYAGAGNQAGVYKGGDFKGVTEKLDYLKDLGVTSIWVTPIVENVPDNVSKDEGKEYYAYHGYWANDFEKLNPHLGSLDDFHRLIDEAAARKINIIVDVVLNHAGYGAEEKFKGMVRTKEEEKKGDDEKGSLSNLPDFKTEEKSIREKLVAWQTDWLNKSKTASGNSIYAFRIDTVKHVDDVTWQHFKNELALKDPDFHLVGESWGANYKDTKGDLGSGTMDSLLDFGFKDIAKLLVNGRLKQAGEELAARSTSIRSNSNLSQFLGSHDEDGFLSSIGGDGNKLKLAASLLLTAKGQPVIYYGEELAQSGKNNWPFYDNRYEFDWTKVKDSSTLAHYKKLLAFRNENSSLLSRGDYSTLSVNDRQKWMLTKQEDGQDAAYILYNLKDKAQQLRLEVSGQDAVLTDYYSDKTYQASKAEDGKWYIDVDAPSIADGGTMLLKVASGKLQGAQSLDVQEETIEEGHIRIHFKKLPAGELSSLGLWLWDDVDTPSSKLGDWPTGATSFSEAKQDEYGYYMDIRLAEVQRNKVGFLINNTKGDNLTGDKSFELISRDMNEVWLDEEYKGHYYQPLQAGTIRLNYFRKDGKYENLALWLWGSADKSITSQLGDWPNGVNFENLGKHGVYMDIPLANLDELGFLLLDESKKGDEAKIQAENYIFKDLKNHSQIFLKDDDKTIYTNPYFVKTVRMTGAQQIALDQLRISMTNMEELDVATFKTELTVTGKDGQAVEIKDVAVDVAKGHLTVTGNFGQPKAPYTVTYHGNQLVAKTNWQYADSLYDYKGELGARVREDGRQVDFTLWSPSADSVALVLYDKQDQDKVVGEVAMTKGDKGQWSTTVSAGDKLGITDYRHYYYHYKIQRGDKSVLVLDPYAKSLAAWNGELAEKDAAHKVAKAAIVDSKALGHQDLDFAKIDGFTAREDAIIYEAHVRDFTSDQAIEKDLQNQFGTFAAFVEKLDYLKDLGVTHVQLLPVMSYYYVNELANKERLNHYASSNTNYNWGYDPQSYFALTGMYSTNPSNPSKRIEEFKNLVAEIHKRGMGIILDVVYNHTAKVDLFEDLEPNYYHFMDASGTAKTSFGGGRLGTTHHMTRRVLVDSISYLVDTFKVDGFRFDMMGDHDAGAIEAAYDAAKALNPNVIMLGEGWVTYAGDDHMPEQPADQTWMAKTDSVASFSDDIRNQLKSGYPNEGQPAFITGGARTLQTIFKNIKAQPSNFEADDPGDVIQYIAAHDNLTLHDIIAQSIKKDPSIAANSAEIHRRLRLGNLLVLTSQGTAFLHSGQEYGRSKQFKDEAYKSLVSEDKVPNKSHVLVNEDGTPFKYPYFIHDSYDSTDAINHFDWAKATDSVHHPETTQSQAYTKGLIALRRSTDAFTLKTKADVDQKVHLLIQPGQHGIGENDLVIAYQTQASNGDIYAVFVNADTKERDFYLEDTYRDLLKAEVIVDGLRAGLLPITSPNGVEFAADGLKLAPLTAVVLRLKGVIDSERVLSHPQTGVSVALAAGESDKIVNLEVTHLETDDQKTPDVLKGEDFDLFDISLVDKNGQSQQNNKPVRVAMPIDPGKQVANVFYLPENGARQDLAFEEHSRMVDGKEFRFVLFTAEHFSQYGLVYKNLALSEGKTDEKKATDDTNQVSSVDVSNEKSDVPSAAQENRADGLAVLPQTGEQSSSLLVVLGMTLLLGTTGAHLLQRNKKEND